MKRAGLIVIALWVCWAGQAQEEDSIRQQTAAVSLVVPVAAALVTYGTLAYFVKPFKRLDNAIDGQVSRWMLRPIKIDDYIQYVPAIYVLDFMGVRAKHSLRDRTFVLASSFLFSATTVQGVKHIVDVQRPDGSADNSFPSGHTATAFMGAHILFREYRETSPWIAVGGYAVATATGGLRIVNRRHWLSDVAAGAGVGILSVEAAYLLLPLFQQIVGKPDTFVLAPIIGGGNYGASLIVNY